MADSLTCDACGFSQTRGSAVQWLTLSISDNRVEFSSRERLGGDLHACSKACAVTIVDLFPLVQSSRNADD